MFFSIPSSSSQIIASTPIGVKSIKYLFFENKNNALFGYKSSPDKVSISIDGRQICRDLLVLPFCTGTPDGAQRRRWQDVALDVNLNVDFSEIKIDGGSTNDFNIVFVCSEEEIDESVGFTFWETAKITLKPNYSFATIVTDLRNAYSNRYAAYYAEAKALVKDAQEKYTYYNNQYQVTLKAYNEYVAYIESFVAWFENEYMPWCEKYLGIVSSDLLTEYQYCGGTTSYSFSQVYTKEQIFAILVEYHKLIYEDRLAQCETVCNYAKNSTTLENLPTDEETVLEGDTNATIRGCGDNFAVCWVYRITDSVRETINELLAPFGVSIAEDAVYESYVSYPNWESVESLIEFTDTMFVGDGYVYNAKSMSESQIYDVVYGLSPFSTQPSSVDEVAESKVTKLLATVDQYESLIKTEEEIADGFDGVIYLSYYGNVTITNITSFRTLLLALDIYNELEDKASSNLGAETYLLFDKEPSQFFAMSLMKPSDYDYIVPSDVALTISMSGSDNEAIPSETDLNLFSTNNKIPYRKAVYNFEDSVGMKRSLGVTIKADSNKKTNYSFSYDEWNLYLFFGYKKLV